MLYIRFSFLHVKFTIYHNPDCSKSCSALAQLKRPGAEVEIIDYISHPPSAEKLRSLIKMLGISASDLVRKNEPEFAPYLSKELGEEDYLQLMLEHPVLIQRPIVACEGKAFIVRPPLTVEELLEKMEKTL